MGKNCSVNQKIKFFKNLKNESENIFSNQKKILYLQKFKFYYIVI